MRDLNQQILKFNHDQNFKDDDFYVSKSNKQIFDLLNKWPKWEKNFLNISGEKFSGKTHLINIFLKKYKGTKIEANLWKFSSSFLQTLKGRLHLKPGSVRPQTLGERVLDDPRHFMFQRRNIKKHRVVRKL